VDVGAAPGGWSQIIAERVNSVEGRETVVGIDLLKFAALKGVHMVQGDIENEQT
jgi:23S rRNA U2552 (ribose-2'-O)-methylase RlmE/FtsJ